MTTQSNKSAAVRASQSRVWMWETYIQESLNGGSSTCRKCTKQDTPCEAYKACMDPSCDYCTSCSHRHCKQCHYNQQMANVIRSSETYQQVLKEYWEGTNWNPLPWAAEFYEKYDFAEYYLEGNQRGLASTATVSVLAYRAALPVLNAA